MLVALRRRFSDVGKQLVRRWVLSFFRFGVFAANALLNFIVQLSIFLLSDNAFLNQLILPEL